VSVRVLSADTPFGRRRVPLVFLHLFVGGARKCTCQPPIGTTVGVARSLVVFQAPAARIKIWGSRWQCFGAVIVHYLYRSDFREQVFSIEFFSDAFLRGVLN
jgi:hypothetical protein